MIHELQRSRELAFAILIVLCTSDLGRAHEHTNTTDVAADEAVMAPSTAVYADSVGDVLTRSVENTSTATNYSVTSNDSAGDENNSSIAERSSAINSSATTQMDSKDPALLVRETLIKPESLNSGSNTKEAIKSSAETTSVGTISARSAVSDITNSLNNVISSAVNPSVISKAARSNYSEEISNEESEDSVSSVSSLAERRLSDLSSSTVNHPVIAEAVKLGLTPDVNDEQSTSTNSEDESSIYIVSSQVNKEISSLHGKNGEFSSFQRSNNDEASTSTRSHNDTDILLSIATQAEHPEASTIVYDIANTSSSSPVVEFFFNNSDATSIRLGIVNDTTDSYDESVSDSSSVDAEIRVAEEVTTSPKEFDGPSRRKFGAPEVLDIHLGALDSTSPAESSSSSEVPSPQLKSGLQDQIPNTLTQNEMVDDPQSRIAFDQMADKIMTTVALSMDSTPPAQPRYILQTFEYPYPYVVPTFPPYGYPFYNYINQINPTVSPFYSYVQRPIMNFNRISPQHQQILSRIGTQNQPTNFEYKPEAYLSRRHFYSGQQPFAAVPRLGSVDNNQIPSDQKVTLTNFGSQVFPRTRYDSSKFFASMKLRNGRFPGIESQTITTARSYNIAYNDESSSSSNIDDQLVERIFKRRA